MQSPVAVMQIFLQGLALGFAIAAPVGPIGLLCIRHTMTDGRLAGFVSGLGAATADAVYGVIAALGVTAITTLLLAHATLIQLGGGLFLLYLGIATLRAKPPSAAYRDEAPPPEAKTSSLGAVYFSTFALTLANPATILAFIAIFSGLGAVTATPHHSLTPLLLVAGIFFGSAAWWLFLSAAASWLSRRLASGALRTINFISGAFILAFGLWQLVTLIRS